MPTYEYECTKCAHKFEKFQKMSDELLKKCPECKGAIKRLIGRGAGIIFKGSGFYATDYKKSEPKKTECPTDGKDKSACKKCPHAKNV
ncbi:MAG: zinc ribbon domain-containing protein [Candidatus Omnitrophica bacterium]|nr:zinc ribbon domain-containing protein [Candidatus Omnitrophota bacterium]